MPSGDAALRAGCAASVPTEQRPSAGEPELEFTHDHAREVAEVLQFLRLELPGLSVKNAERAEVVLVTGDERCRGIGADVGIFEHERVALEPFVPRALRNG
jgi:hypothetical protein